MMRWLCLFCLPVAIAMGGDLAFRSWAPTPPMGWNSWDNFGTAITETEVRETAASIAAKLRSHGWQYVVVDIEWYQPTASGHGYQPGAALTLDAFGRPLPAPNRFPSSTGGRGFGPLAGDIHALGLKFGVHLLRGIPRQAVAQNLPILGTSARARDIADVHSLCPWNPDMYGVDMTKPGAQAYYDSLFALLASWGVDFVKVDDLSRPYWEHRREVEAIRSAIDHSGRPMILSLSPGPTPLSAAAHVADHANMWRISDDFWDRWLPLWAQFRRLAAWSPHGQAGAWPDADMLPLGRLDFDSRSTRLTADEQRTLMTLWCVARSPLILGADARRLDPDTLALLTNDEVLAVNQNSRDNHPVFNHDGLWAWEAAVPHSADRYLALFNARDRVPLTPKHAQFAMERAAGDPPVPVAVDVAFGRLLVLAAIPDHDEGEGTRAIWRKARFILSDGRQLPLGKVGWTKADALWDSAEIKRNANGEPVALSAQAPEAIEFEIPDGAVRFEASLAVERGSATGQRAPVDFLVVVAKDQNTDWRDGLPITVPLARLGLGGSVLARDLWSDRVLGPFSTQITAVVPFHGAEMYRLSTQP